MIAEMTTRVKPVVPEYKKAGGGSLQAAPEERRSRGRGFAQLTVTGWDEQGSGLCRPPGRAMMRLFVTVAHGDISRFRRSMNCSSQQLQGRPLLRLICPDCCCPKALLELLDARLRDLGVLQIQEPQSSQALKMLEGGIRDFGPL